MPSSNAAASSAPANRRSSVSESNESAPILRIGTNDINDFDRQKAFMERSGNEAMNVPHLHSSKSMERLNGAPRTRPMTDLTMEDFTSLHPREFHPRDDQPMMGRGGHGWISEVDGTTTTTAATPKKGSK